MEQFNVISEGGRAAGRAHVMGEGYPARCQAACGSPACAPGGSGAEEWVRAHRPPLRPGGRAGEGTGEATGSQSLRSGIAGSRGSRSRRKGSVPSLPHRCFWETEALCSGGREVEKLPLDSVSASLSFLACPMGTLIGDNPSGLWWGLNEEGGERRAQGSGRVIIEVLET